MRNQEAFKRLLGSESMNTRWANWVLPLSFVLGGLINFGFYYLGLAFVENVARHYGFLLGNIVFAVLCALTLLRTLRRERMPKSTWLLLGGVVVFYLGCFGLSLFQFGFDTPLLPYAAKFIVICLPAFFAGIFAALRRTEGGFLPMLEKASVFVLPAAISYVNGALFLCNPFNYGRNLGIVGYMTFAYAIMPFLLAHLLAFAESAKWVWPITGKKAKRPQVIRGLFIAVYWIAIIASGTRGAYVSITGFCALLVLSKILHRERVKPVFFVSAAMAALLLFNIFVYAPPGMYGVQRMSIFLDGLKTGQLITDTEDVHVADKINDLVQADGNQQVINRPETPNIVDENIQVGSRGTLYKLAIKEFQKAPLTGMGPGGYSVKYGMYPHNVLLELLCETGIFGAIPLLLVILFAFGKMLVLGWRDPRIRMLLLFFMAYAIQANISGALWTCAPLLCALGYALALSGSGRNTGPKGDIHNKI